MANPFDNPDFGKGVARRNPFDDPSLGRPGGGTFEYIDNLVRQAAQGATLGSADEAVAAAEALRDQNNAPRGIAADLPDHGRTLGQSYDRALTAGRSRDRAFHDENPVAASAANVGGALAALPLMPGMATGRGLLAVGRGMLTGAGYGGAAGFMSGEGDNRPISGAIGAGLGAGLGGLIPAAMAGGKWAGRAFNESAAGRWFSNNVTAPGYEAGARVLESVAPKTTPKSLSAAAPDGSVVPTDSITLRLADMLRNRADAGRGAATRGAQERLAGEFERQGMDPQAISRELMRVGDGGVLANAGGVATQRLARTAYDAPGPAAGIIDDALTAQRAGTPNRVQSAFEGAEPPPTAYDAQRFLTLNKDRVGDELYDPFRRSGIQISDDMKRLIETTPALKEAYDGLVAEAVHLGKTLTPFDLHHGLKRQMNAAAQGKERATGTPVNKEWLDNLANRWEGALYEANPGIQSADQSFARAAQLPERFQQGRDFLRSGTGEAATEVSPSALAATLPGLDDAGRLAFRAGSTNTARDIAMTGPAPARRLAGNIDENQILQQKLIEIYGPERAAEIIRMGGAERSMMRTDAAIRGGPNTASKLAHLVDDGLQMPSIPASMSAPTLLTRAVDAGANWMRRQNSGNEPVRTEMARMLMQNNPSANLQTLEAIEALMRQRMAAQLMQGRAGAGASAVGGGQTGGAY